MWTAQSGSHKRRLLPVRGSELPYMSLKSVLRKTLKEMRCDAEQELLLRTLGAPPPHTAAPIAAH